MKERGKRKIDEREGEKDETEQREEKKRIDERGS
jgi:hypothetical protein